MAMWLMRYDLRAPAWGDATHAELYAACLDQCAWADDLGAMMVVLSEHHGIAEDGYLPSPMVLAGAIAGRTKRIRISIQALLLPLHDPLRVAEDLAVLDLISGGRVMTTVGLGYRDEEFEMFGVDRRKRAPILEEGVRAMLAAWTGEPFEYQGRTVQITPRPMTQPHPMLFVGGSVPAGAKRAARLRLPFMSAADDPTLKTVYDDECAAASFTKGFAVIPHDPVYVHVSEDPEKAWAQIGPHVLHDAQSYDSWQKPDQTSAVHVHATDLDAVRASGVYRALTPDETVALAAETGTIILHPLVGGLPPAVGWESLELFASSVLPRL
jgi:alkanesulfonate monooxygenase SsuD/methylene tetrahydromethanopterin reductase-like flavin-dependent oxidoreductase (luciferase family)